MTGIVASHDTFTKELSWAEGRALCAEFLTYNKLRIPKYTDGTPFVKGPGMYGFYRPEQVRVNVRRTRPLTRVPGFSWTFTGWKSDLTAAGVTCHETGHHIDHCLDYPSDKWRRIEERPVSGYRPNREEDFAEAMRLFILNPDLLYQAWPIRFGLLEREGLRPIVNLGWEEVLANADDDYFDAAERLIEKAGQ